MLHSLLTSALEGGGWSASLHLCLMPGSESLYAMGGRLCVSQSHAMIRQDEKLSVLLEDEKAILWLPSSVTIVTELRSK